MLIKKEDLLKIDLFVNNNFLDDYINFINDKQLNDPIKYKSQKHHVIPRFYYKENGLKVENKNNIINLVYSDHIVAHYLLELCTTKKYKNKSFASIYYIMKNPFVVDKSLDFILENLERFDELYSDYRHNLVLLCQTNEAREKAAKSQKAFWQNLKENNPEEYKYRCEMISKRLKAANIKISDETRAKLSAKAKLRVGEKNPFFGKTHSAETIEKIKKINAISIFATDGFNVISFQAEQDAAQYITSIDANIGISGAFKNIKKAIKECIMYHNYYWYIDNIGWHTKSPNVSSSGKLSIAESLSKVHGKSIVAIKNGANIQFNSAKSAAEYMKACNLDHICIKNISRKILNAAEHNEYLYDYLWKFI